MAEQDVLTLLARHRSLGSAPASEHAWLAAHGTFRSLAIGDVLAHKGEAARSLHVVFSGRIAIHLDRGAGSHKMIEQRGGDVTGQLPFSRGTMAPNDVVVEEPTELLEIPKEHLSEMIRECPVATATMVHAMLDRARHITSSDLRDETLISLGRLAAGLTHELNNPASAAVRSAKTLAESLAAAEAAATALGATRLSKEQMAAINDVRERCRAPAAGPAPSALARADREEAIGAWLSQHAVDDAYAAPLAETGVMLTALDGLAATVGGDTLDVALRSIAAGCVVRALSAEVETSTSRIYELVNAVKRFTFMDHAPTSEPVDIRRGITDTLTMLGAKTRVKSVDVSVQFPVDLPRAHAVGAELNQLWMNLIDNALDAVAVGGHVMVTADRELGRLVVDVIDDGPGIPPEIQRRVFDPFFTTKAVGQGAGLGLAIVKRLVQRHDGEVEMDSRPGRTVFRVRLPCEQ